MMTETGVAAKFRYQGAKVRKLLLSVTNINRKGNIVVFDGDDSALVPASAPELTEIRKLMQQAQTRIPFHPKNWVFVMKTWKVPNAPESKGTFRRQGR